MEEFDTIVGSVTPREKSPTVDIYQNTVGLACPSCEEPFDDLIVCKELTRLNLSERMDICPTTHEESTVIFTHKSSE